MPYLTPIQGEVVVALVTILIGLLIEKWYVSRSSIIANGLTWIVIIATIDLSGLTHIIMLSWLLIGMMLVWTKGNGEAKQLFGSKVFGSLALILGLNQLWDLGLGEVWLLIFWVITAVFVFFLGKKFEAE